MDVQDVILQQAFNFAAMCWAYTPEDLTEEEKRLRGLIVLGFTEEILNPSPIEIKEIIEFMERRLQHGQHDAFHEESFKHRLRSGEDFCNG